MKSQPDYSHQKILFTAFSVADGSEELAGYAYLTKHGASDITALYWGGKEIAEHIPADVHKIEIKPHYVDQSLTAGYDLVFRHQTTRPEEIASPITSNTVEFFKYCPAPIIGVTGTKGKGTTATLIAKILEKTGTSVHLLGNIGNQAIANLDAIKPDDIVVFELSSFQLWDLHQSPHVAVVLMIDEDHQDVHASMQEYVNAKANIAAHQGQDDVLIYHPDNRYSAQIARKSKGSKSRFMSTRAAHIKDGFLHYQKTAIMPIDEVGLVGAHNLENICAAVSAAWCYTNDVEAIAKAVSEFKGLDHRLEEVASKNGVRYFNDSFSAAPAAAAAAVMSFEEPSVMIFGGYTRNVSFAKLAEAVAASNMRTAVLIGENKHQIATAFDDANVDNYQLLDVDNMSEIVEIAARQAEPGDVVVLSPGSPSFDLFDNYKQRGQLFRDAVEALASTTAVFDTFYFESYDFDYATGLLTLKYRFDTHHQYVEHMQFELPQEGVDEKNLVQLVESIAFYIFMVAGTSYYKLFPTKRVELEQGQLDAWQADFFTMLYRGGLSQFVYENQLSPDDIVDFAPTVKSSNQAHSYSGDGILLMQSGGKDSLLSAELLKKFGHNFSAWHMSSTGAYPQFLDTLGQQIVSSRRTIDLRAITRDRKLGGLNGHIPFSALYAGAGLLQAVLLNKSLVIASNEASSDEANIVVDGYSVNHQFSKTFKVELALQEYIHRYISRDLNYGSLLRPFSELYVGELFAQYAWPKYYRDFSSCNQANYKQGAEDGTLKWDGTCPKCANTFVLMAPFVDKKELLEIFDGKNLLQSEDMQETYLQLFGLSDIKPFECVGTFDEMQQAYAMATAKDPGYRSDSLPVMPSHIDYRELGNYQPLFDNLIDYYDL